MIRTSRHTLKFANEVKQVWISTLLQDYQIALQTCVDMILQERLPLKRFLSTKDVPILGNIKGGQWKQLVYKNASEIVRSNLAKTKKKVRKKYNYLYAKCKQNNIHNNFTRMRMLELNINYMKRLPKIKINNVTINLDIKFWNSTLDSSFDEFIEIKLPYIKDGYKVDRKTIKIPIKQHKHSLKYKNWNRKNTIQLSRHGIKFIYEKNAKEKRPIEKSLGVDLGYKKLITTSTNHYYGLQLQQVYEKLSNQKQGSKNFKQTLIERDNLINMFCNILNAKEQFDELIIEDLKNVKHKSKFSKKTNNKLQRWSYSKTIDKLERLSDEEGFLITKIDPAYTSQTCSNCGNVDKKSRKGENYQCNSCKISIDADYNAAINILHRGIYSSSGRENNFTIFW